VIVGLGESFLSYAEPLVTKSSAVLLLLYVQTAYVHLFHCNIASTQQADESLALLELVVQRAPTDAALQLQLATALVAASKQARADVILQALLDKHPSDGKHQLC
jgi:predicted Zn-dependent protease